MTFGVASRAQLLDVLGHVLRFHDTETAFIVIESALNASLVHPADVRAICVAAPARTGQVLERADRLSESGAESRVVLHLGSRNVAFRQQVVIAGVGRVDLLVGRSLVIELDSRAHHTGEENYERDRRRDVALGSAGYRVLRLTWAQVFLQWEATREALDGMIRTRTHRYLQGPASHTCAWATGTPL